MKVLNSEAGRIAAMVLIVILSFGVSWLVKKGMVFLYRNSSRKQKDDPGRFVLFVAITRFLILMVGVSFAISLEPHIKSLSTSLLTGAGIATAVVGFASKDVLANFVSGTVIILFRPFTLTHWINVGNVHEGSVEEIKMLYTVIKDKSNRRMIIPNSKILSSYVINSSYGDARICQHVEFNVSYGSDIDMAKQIISEVAAAHPFCLDNRTSSQKKENHPVVEVRLMNFGEFAITLRALIWVKNPLDARTVCWALNEKVKERFDEMGIEIPLPYRNLVFKNDFPASNN